MRVGLVQGQQQGGRDTCPFILGCPGRSALLWVLVTAQTTERSRPGGSGLLRMLSEGVFLVTPPPQSFGHFPTICCPVLTLCLWHLTLQKELHRGLLSPEPGVARCAWPASWQ